MLSRNTDVAGVTLEKVANLMVAVAAAGNNGWIHSKARTKRFVYYLNGTVANMKMTLVEDKSSLSLRGDGWLISLICDNASYRYDSFKLPAPAGARPTTSSKADVFSASIHDVHIKSANAFKHDMTILLMFESEWES